jgi:hypothetical protein
MSIGIAAVLTGHGPDETLGSHTNPLHERAVCDAGVQCMHSAQADRVARSY